MAIGINEFFISKAASICLYSLLKLFNLPFSCRGLFHLQQMFQFVSLFAVRVSVQVC